MNYKLIRSVAAIAVVGMLATACQKDDNQQKETLSQDLNGARVAAANALEDCAWNTDTVDATGTGYSYTATTPVSFTFPGGPSIQFEGNAASFIRPTTTDWFVGVDDQANACSEWDDIKATIERRNDATKIGAAPASPCGVVGYNTVTTSYGLGYYAYSQTPPNVPVVNKNVVLWYDQAGTSACYDSNPNLITFSSGYVVAVQSFTVTGAPPTVNSRVIFKWRAL